MTNEFILQDRIQKIQQVVYKYGINKFIISFSGGKDSTVLSELVDLAIPNNKIPRVYCNTGIEYKSIVDFVKAKAAVDERFEIIQPKVPIKQMLERDGYPFKSKEYSERLHSYQLNGYRIPYIEVYYSGIKEDGTKVDKRYTVPNCLRYQFEDPNALSFKVSKKCCDRLKKQPLADYQFYRNKPYSILGIRAEEGGGRSKAKCMVFSGSKLRIFQPLVAVTKEWEKQFIKEYNVQLAELYYPPYNFERTGCKGCPFAQELQYELDILEKYFPNERKQCEIIWKPVYEEYRRIGYRLK